MKSPIFLFSLPRSGSTLLQRVLMSHSQVSSVAEPWILLPFCYATKRDGALSEYNNISSAFAVQDFVANLPNAESDYYLALNEFVSKLYQKHCRNGELYFLDKTPRYYLIISDIVKIYPDAKFIFLFRNPLDVMSSMVKTWCDGGFGKMYAYEADLNDGPRALSEGYALLADKSIAIQYEKFVKNPIFYTKEICAYLGLNIEDAMVNEFSAQDTNGRMGDPTGVFEYSSISLESLDKWRKVFSTSYRKKVAFKYVQSLDEGVLRAQGYSKDKMLMDVDSLRVSFSFGFRDRLAVLYAILVRYLKANIFFKKSIWKWAKGRYLT